MATVSRREKKCWRVPLGQLMMDLLWIYPFSRMQIVTTKIITFLGSLLTFICRPITGWGVRSKVSIYIVRNLNLNLRYVRICILWWEVDPGFIQEFLKTPEVLGFRCRKHQVLALSTMGYILATGHWGTTYISLFYVVNLVIVGIFNLEKQMGYIVTCWTCFCFITFLLLQGVDLDMYRYIIYIYIYILYTCFQL